MNNSDDVIDSRDVISRIEELTELRDAVTAAEAAVTEAESKHESALVALGQASRDLEGAPEDDFETFAALVAAAEAEVSETESELDEAESELDGANIDFSDSDRDELAALVSLQDEAEDYSNGDWRHGATLIRESYFEDYCKELLQDIGALPKDLPGYLVIDWEATADNLRIDYTEVDFDGVAYLIR